MNEPIFTFIGLMKAEEDEARSRPRCAARVGVLPCQLEDAHRGPHVHHDAGDPTVYLRGLFCGTPEDRSE